MHFMGKGLQHKKYHNYTDEILIKILLLQGGCPLLEVKLHW